MMLIIFKTTLHKEMNLVTTLCNVLRHGCNYIVRLSLGYMEIADSACVPTFSFPFALDCHQYYELMVTQGEGRSPMTSSDAETDSKPIIIIIF